MSGLGRRTLAVVVLVLDGEFAVVTKGQGKRIVKKGEIEYASKGTVHGEPCDW